MSESAKRRAKQRAKKEQQGDDADGTATAAAAAPASAELAAVHAPAAAAPAVAPAEQEDPQKELKRLQKKLKQVSGTPPALVLPPFMIRTATTQGWRELVHLLTLRYVHSRTHRGHALRKCMQITELRESVQAGAVTPNADQQAKLASENEVKARIQQLITLGAKP